MFSRILTAPVFLPLAKAFNVALVHLGVVMTANLAIALYTPLRLITYVPALSTTLVRLSLN